MTAVTAGWLARHTPSGPGGRYAALIDIAQDLLLARLHQQGVFEHLVLKGGTALRKVYAGNAGRFSTDLDFSVRHLGEDPETVTQLLSGEIHGQRIDGFTYTVQNHRGRAHVRYATPFGGIGNLTTKLDIGPPPWLPPVQRGWIRLAIHQAYRLPTSIPVMALEENMAEKVARLTRRTPARDVYDLVWIASTSPHSGFDRAAVRRLAVLKNWVDQHGLASSPAVWEPVTGAAPYLPAQWLTIRRAQDFDDESIGLLACEPCTNSWPNPTNSNSGSSPAAPAAARSCSTLLPSWTVPGWLTAAFTDAGPDSPRQRRPPGVPQRVLGAWRTAR